VDKELLIGLIKDIDNKVNEIKTEKMEQLFYQKHIKGWRIRYDIIDNMEKELNQLVGLFQKNFLEFIHNTKVGG